MQSPISPIVANLSMEEFEIKAINSIPHPPGCGLGMWMTLLSSRSKNTVTNSCNTSTALTHTFSSPRRLLTLGVPLLFLDTLVLLGPDNTLLTTVYRKPTCADQYIHWIATTICQLNIVFNTLTYKGRTDYTTPKLLFEEEHIGKALSRCKYPTPALNRMKARNNLTVTHMPIAGSGAIIPAPAWTTPMTTTTTSTLWFLVPRVSQKCQEHLW